MRVYKLVGWGGSLLARAGLFDGPTKSFGF